MKEVSLVLHVCLHVLFAVCLLTRVSKLIVYKSWSELSLLITKIYTITFGPVESCNLKKLKFMKQNFIFTIARLSLLLFNLGTHIFFKVQEIHELFA